MHGLATAICIRYTPDVLYLFPLPRSEFFWRWKNVSYVIRSFTSDLFLFRLAYEF
jgi:hypothetical protein